MKVVHKNQTKMFLDTAVCSIIDYPSDDKDINIAIVTINGRYPEKGKLINVKCKEAAYVMEGTGKLFVENNIVNLKEGSMVVIEPGEKYYWDGNMELVVPCTPAWYPEQSKEIHDDQ